jgi:hypothetical protein
MSPTNSRHRFRQPLLALTALLLASAALIAASAPARPQRDAVAPGARTRVKLQPKFIAGQVMRYRIELQSTSETKSSGAVHDPEGHSRLAVTWDAVVRLEVLAATPSSVPTTRVTRAPAIRLRTTYEKSAAEVESDTPDPDAADTEKQYAQLEGRSIEFTVDSDGRISNVTGLEGIVSDDKARSAAEQWMAQISAAASSPAAGVVPGQKWSSQEPASSLPLAGFLWRTDSTYLRNEPCRPANPAGAESPSAGDLCAVILARLELVAPHAEQDPTPDEYRRNGLRSSGHWTSTGESLTYVSLANGWVVSVTQSGTEQMDVSLGRATGDAVRYAGTVTSRSQAVLLPPEPSGAP